MMAETFLRIHPLSFVFLAGALLSYEVGAPRTTQKKYVVPRPVVVLGGVFALIFMGLLTHLGAAVLAGGLVAATVAWCVRDMQAARQIRRSQDIQAAYLGALVAELRAGASVPKALSGASRRLPATCGDSQRRDLEHVAVIAASGAPVSPALRAAHFPELAALMEVGESAGIPLATLCEKEQQRLDAASRHRRATSASLQGPQSTAAVLCVLPFLGLGLGSAMGAAPLKFLFDGGIGSLLLVVGTALVCAGFSWSRIIIKGAEQ